MSKKESFVNQKLRKYRKKYYLNELYKGLLFSLILLLVFFLLANTLDFTFKFGGIARACLFFAFVGLGAWLFIFRILLPVLRLFSILPGLDDTESAQNLGSYFPQIRDKLLNLLQLQKQADSSTLAQASIEQKSKEIAGVEFEEAVDSKTNGKYAGYLALPAGLVVILVFVFPQLFITSTPRIINFNEEYKPIAPFSFMVDKAKLRAYKNEDFELMISLDGTAFPEDVYLVHKDLRYKMLEHSEDKYSFVFEKIQNDKRIYFEGAGFTSESYIIEVVQRPNLKSFNVELKYPTYTGLKDERISNVGNLNVPEGTKIQWLFNSLNTSGLQIEINDEEILSAKKDKDLFSVDYAATFDAVYKVSLENQYGTAKDQIEYMIEVTKDEYPKITVGSLTDTLTYKSINIAGNIADDYGIRKLTLNYYTGEKKDKTTINIPISKQQLSQAFYHNWVLDSLVIDQGQQLNYYLEVWDNDGVNGSKSSKSQTFVFNMPDEDQLKSEIDKAGEQTKGEMKNIVERAKDLEEMINELEERLKSKPDMNWQDEQLLKELLKEREAIEKQLQKMNEEFKDLQKKKEQFLQQNEQTKQKADQLDKLMEDLLDEETRKILDELQKMLEEKYNKNEVENRVDDLKKNQKNLSKNLERTLELFKRLQLEQKLDQAISELDELSEEQEEISKETDSNETSNEEKLQDQEELSEDFKDFQEQMEEIKELNQDLKNPEPIRDISQENNSIEELQEQIKQDLQQGKKQDAKQKQQRSAQKMKELSKKMQQMQAGMEMMMQQENLDNLRQILNNLIKLSFDQESLMMEFRGVNQSDPRFVDLGQEQLKLKDDAKIIEDSLLALASRTPLANTITKEVMAMNDNLESSLKAIKERKKPIAVSNQQLAMTSINNLALMLDNSLSNMMQMMSNAMGNQKSNQQKNKPGESLSDMQMKLNQQIQDLQQSGKSGRELSEELAKLAAEQEQIRRALQEMQQKYGNKEGSAPGGNDIPRKMEQTEVDLVNKRITQQTIKRQKEIVTRLLEAEDAMRERDLDEEREAETALDQYENNISEAFEEYFKTKQKEIELLKTVPPRLYPYYKKEVNDYFDRLRSEQNF